MHIFIMKLKKRHESRVLVLNGINEGAKYTFRAKKRLHLGAESNTWLRKAQPSSDWEIAPVNVDIGQ